MNHKIILFFLITLSSSVFAIDVSNFDIKGVKLGMNKKQVKAIFPCLKTGENRNNKFNIILNYYGKCSNDKQYIEAIFDHNDKLYRFLRKIYFSTMPKKKKLRRKLYLSMALLQQQKRIMYLQEAKQDISIVGLIAVLMFVKTKTMYHF